MIAIVYSGSRYANWRLSNKGKDVIELRTNGINPFFNDEKYINQLLNKNAVLINHAEEIKKIYFFGAGSSSVERNETVKNALESFFKFSKVHVSHDLEAAAKASCDDKPGIICIIGSGSNTGFFDGKKVLSNNYGLGFAIGDEGSANWLGKTILKSYLNQTMPKKLASSFEKKYELDRKQIMDKIYKQSHASTFLTSFSEFFKEHREEDFIKNMIKEGFRLFMDIYLVPISQKYGGKHPVYFVGSVAANYQDILREVAKEKNINISSVIKEPIYNLLNYYANKN
jgi:N-acetylglucosamine kinase-like BadF-type ATPase